VLSVVVVALVMTCGAGPWAFRAAPTKVMAWLASSCLALLIAGAVLAPDLVWADVPIVAFAVLAGVLLGRVVPPRARPMLLLLLAVSVLDVLQVVMLSRPSGGTGGRCSLYTSVCLHTPWGAYGVGAGDLLMVAAMSEHWRRRGAALWLSLAPGLVGFTLVDPFVQLTGLENLALLPFLTAGWLGSQG
jgi:hypothetical protein